MFIKMPRDAMKAVPQALEQEVSCYGGDERLRAGPAVGREQ